MKIYAKSTFEASHLYDKVVRKNNRLIELQLFEPLTNLTKHEVQKVLDVSKGNINIVHSSLAGGKASSLLDVLDTPHSHKFYNGLEFAERLRKIQKLKRIKFIVHSDVSEEYWKIIIKNTEFLKKWKILLAEYPYIDFLVENIMFIDRNDYGISGSGGAMFEAASQCDFMNNYFSCLRFESVLDITHALSSIRILNELKLNQESKEITLDTYFQKFKSTIGLIHLSNCIGFGYEKGKHGVGFDEDSKNELYKILNIYQKYNYRCPITIEVLENDYTDSISFEQTKDLITKYFSGDYNYEII